MRWRHPEHGLLLPGAERSARGPENLDPARDPLPVGGAYSGRESGIRFGEKCMGMGTGLRDLGPDFLPDICRNLGNGREPFGKRPEVEARAADNDGQTSAPCDVAHRRRRKHRPAARRERRGGVRDAVEVMGHARFFRFGRPGGQHPHLAVTLHGVGVDDLAAQPFGKVERQGRLAACGRPCNKDGTIYVDGIGQNTLIGSCRAKAWHPRLPSEPC